MERRDEKELRSKDELFFFFFPTETTIVWWKILYGSAEESHNYPK